MGGESVHYYPVHASRCCHHLLHMDLKLFFLTFLLPTARLNMETGESPLGGKSWDCQFWIGKYLENLGNFERREASVGYDTMKSNLQSVCFLQRT